MYIHSIEEDEFIFHKNIIKYKHHEETLKLWKATGKANGHHRRSQYCGCTSLIIH